MDPSSYLYSRHHLWVSVDENIATVGITEFSQQQLGEVVFVDLPEVEKVFERDDVLGSIESVKALSEIYTPLSGTIVETNSSVFDDPELLNEDPQGEGWLVKISISDASQLASLMNASAYQDYVKYGEY